MAACFIGRCGEGGTNANQGQPIEQAAGDGDDYACYRSYFEGQAANEEGVIERCANESGRQRSVVG